MPSAGTRQTQYRLEPSTLDLMDRLAERYGLRGRAAVIRYAIADLSARTWPDGPPRPPKKSRGRLDIGGTPPL